MEVSDLLRSFNTKLTPSAEIEKIREKQPGVSRKIEAQMATSRKIIQEEASLEDCRGNSGSGRICSVRRPSVCCSYRFSSASRRHEMRGMILQPFYRFMKRKEDER